MVLGDGALAAHGGGHRNTEPVGEAGNRGRGAGKDGAASGEQ